MYLFFDFHLYDELVKYLVLYPNYNIHTCAYNF